MFIAPLYYHVRTLHTWAIAWLTSALTWSTFSLTLAALLPNFAVIVNYFCCSLLYRLCLNFAYFPVFSASFFTLFSQLLLLFLTFFLCQLLNRLFNIYLFLLLHKCLAPHFFVATFTVIQLISHYLYELLAYLFIFFVFPITINLLLLNLPSGSSPYYNLFYLN